jgi:NAD(P)H-nitrite reductase large subunit
MELDDDVCICFHVSKRKIVNFVRLENPRRVSQLSQCQGAGTGCGWCRPILEKLFENAGEQVGETVDGATDSELSFEEHAQLRQQYIADGHGKPPG